MKSEFVTQFKLMALASVAAGMGVFAPVAQAAIVTSWGYSTSATFTSAAFETNGDPGAAALTPSTLTWGNSSGDFTTPSTNFLNNKSALTIGNGESGADRYNGLAATGTVGTVIGGLPTLADAGLGVTFTHFNNPISSGYNSLLSGSIFDTLTLTPISPLGSAVAAPNINFNFEFRETPNDPTSGICAGGESSSLGEGCGDLFGFAGIPNLNQAFNYDGQQYFASVLVLGPNFEVSPIAFLNDGQCAALGYTSGTSGQRCQGFQTAENAATTVRFGFVVTTEPLPVPEPGTLALMGLAILGLGVMRARKSS